jgi:IMP and pyridine-specific 5'-nucleotidase
MLVPTIGMFFTGLPLRKAFLLTDFRRAISQRRFVAPSFNGTTPLRNTNGDIRRLLCTAQILALTSGPEGNKLKLITLDGDVTLYPDGSILLPENPVIPHMIELLRRGVYVGIVTAAGYPEPSGKEYNRRLEGLLTALRESDLPLEKKRNLVLVGGECNYLFRFNGEELEWIEESQWKLDEMSSWTENDIKTLLDIAQVTLLESAKTMHLQVLIIRKPKAVGSLPPSYRALIQAWSPTT